MNSETSFCKWIVIVLLISCFSQLYAGDRRWDFESDPFNDFEFINSTQLDFVWGGQGFDRWGAEGNPGGFLSLTEAKPNMSTIAILPDIDQGRFIGGFRTKMDVRMGNGTSDRPADGFSVNFARAPSTFSLGDPILSNLERGSADPKNAATNGAVETGTQTGVSVCFDTWAGNSLPDGPDIEGVIVRVDNVTVGSFAMPVRHGESDDVNSLQTGPQGGSPQAPMSERGDPSLLSWQPLDVLLDPTGKLSVSYKGNYLIENLQTGYFPSPSQIVLMGRTGGANQVQHIDNIHLQTFDRSECGFLAGVETLETSVTVKLSICPWWNDSPSVMLFNLDGQERSDQLETSTHGNQVWITFDLGTAWESASVHSLQMKVKFSDDLIQDYDIEFSTPKYATIPASMALEEVDTLNEGFLITVKQSEFPLSNSIDIHSDHLWDESQNMASKNSSGAYVWNLPLINLEQNGQAKGEFLRLNDGSIHDRTDSMIPGIPGIGESTDFVTALIETVVRIPEKGSYEFGFNSDDGFLSRIGADPTSFITVGEFDGGRGSYTTRYIVHFEKEGDYPMQTLWYEGTGGASLEWFTVQPTRALLNDTAHGGLQTFATRPKAKTRVRMLSPEPGATDVSAKESIVALIEDSDASVDPDSFSALVNGIEMEVTATKSGAFTRATIHRGKKAWDPAQHVSVALNYLADNQAQNVNWSWLVADYSSLSIDNASALGTGKDPGFVIRVLQVDQAPLSGIDVVERLLKGEWGGDSPNNASEVGGTVSADPARPGIVFHIDNLINMDEKASSSGSFLDRGDGSFLDRLENPIPGIPGINGEADHMAMEILTYIEFPAAGYYDMVFFADDGFLVSETHGAGEQRGTTLGQLDGIRRGFRSGKEVTFGFSIPAAGVYPLRAIWYEVVGDANLEWSSLVDGQKILINDWGAGGLRAYQNRDKIAVTNTPGLAPSISFDSGNVVIEFNGILKQSENVSGPYSEVLGAKSPYNIPASNQTHFFIAE